jgi:hypothetical protein
LPRRHLLFSVGLFFKITLRSHELRNADKLSKIHFPAESLRSSEDSRGAAVGNRTEIDGAEAGVNSAKKNFEPSEHAP